MNAGNRNSNKLITALVAVLLAVAPANAAALNSSMDPVLRSSSDSAIAKTSNDYSLRRGSILLNVKEPMQLKSAGAVVDLEKGAVALITREQGYFQVANLCENKAGSIKVNLLDKTITLCGGNEFMLAKNPETLNNCLAADQIARRRMAITPLPNGPIYTVSEFSISTLIQHSGIVKALGKNNDKPEQELFSRLLKFTACLSLATALHGDYEFVR